MHKFTVKFTNEIGRKIEEDWVSGVKVMIGLVGRQRMLFSLLSCKIEDNSGDGSGLFGCCCHGLMRGNLFANL